jgi:HAD superfamily hydrolase (TIGR01509 family)
VTTATAPVATRAGDRTPRAARLPVVEKDRVAPASDGEPIDLEALSAEWQRALDAAGRALAAADDSLPPRELHDRRLALAQETERTASFLRELARGGREPAPWLSPTPVMNRMLGLPDTVQACVFDMESVLTDSSLLHAWAWGHVFDDFLSRVSERTGWHLIPFDRVADYREYVEGRSRLDGVQTFLQSRGIHVPLGRPDDASDVESAFGLARHKGELLERRLQEQGVSALPGARRYLEATRRAGLQRAVVYESASTLPMLEQAGLASLVDARIDAAVISSEDLRSRPAPDLLLAACRRLDVAPEHVATFTNSPAGIIAGDRAGMLPIGVGEDSVCKTLEGFGADLVAPSLSMLLDPRLRQAVAAEQ